VTLQENTSSLENAADDGYSASAWKLAVLLGLGRNDLVALVGSVPERWCNSFRDGDCDVTECADANGLASLNRPAACIIWCPGDADTAAGAHRVAAALASDGRMLLLRRSRLSLFAGRRSAKLLTDRTARLWWIEKRALSRAGLSVERVWIPWPSFEYPEEFLGFDEPDELKASAGLNNGWWARLRASAHDGYAMLTARAGTVKRPIGTFVTSRLRGNGEGANRWRVTRFDMRDRGALVLMLSDGSGKSLVARVAKRGAVEDHISANDEKLRRLHRAAAQTPNVVSLLPDIGERLDGDGYTIWTEKRLCGTVAWRVAPRLRERLDRDWMRFLTDLSTVGRHHLILDRANALTALERFHDSRSLRGEIASEVHELTRWLVDQVSGRECAFSWSHGDFGYGNLLANPYTGSLTGVIDWETASEKEFCGVDWMNMLIAREGAIRGIRFDEAFVRVLESLSGDSTGWDGVVGAFAAFLDSVSGNKEEWLASMLGITLLRALQRQSRYPQIFRKSEVEYLRALRRFHKAIIGQPFTGEGP